MLLVKELDSARPSHFHITPSPLSQPPSPNWSGGRQRFVKGHGRRTGRRVGRSSEILASSNEQLSSCREPGETHTNTPEIMLCNTYHPSPAAAVHYFYSRLSCSRSRVTTSPTRTWRGHWAATLSTGQNMSHCYPVFYCADRVFVLADRVGQCRPPLAPWGNMNHTCPS